MWSAKHSLFKFMLGYVTNPDELSDAMYMSECQSAVGAYNEEYGTSWDYFDIMWDFERFKEGDRVRTGT